MRSKLLFVLSLTLPVVSNAGIFEVGVTGSYRKSTVDDYNWEDRKEIGASVSYYFWAQSAIELSYTARLSTKSIGTATPSVQRTEIQTEELYYGADLVLSLTDMKSSIRPYIKGGALYIHKKEQYQQVQPTTDPANYAPFQDGWAPSVGAGIKIGLTETMSIKVGLETWNMTLYNGQKQYDYAGRAGLTWLF